MKRTWLMMAAALAACLAATAADDVVRATGVAKSYRAAVTEALVAALEQHEGTTVSFEEVAAASEGASSTTEIANGEQSENARQKMDDSISTSMKKWAKGKIKSYDVLSDSVENGVYRVEVAAHFDGKYDQVPTEGNRRRMAILNFRAETGDSYTWYGQSESSAQWADTLASQLNDRLTQSRKFSVLDRRFDSEINAELGRLSDPNAAKDSSVRLGQRLGTDYLLVGSVRFIPVAAPPVNPLTGQTMQVGSQPFCEVNYRVILAPTGQVKWSDTVRIDAVDFQAGSIGVFASMTAAAVAERIADGMMANILPFEVVGTNAAGEIMIGEGGQSLAVGERLTVYALGEEVVDTRTGEVIDQVETPVGDVEVTRVTAKVSYAKVLGGDSGKMTVGSRLRRVPASPADADQNAARLPMAPPPVTGVMGTPSGGIVTPF